MGRLTLITHTSGMATPRDDDHTGVAALNDLFRCQAALNSALGRWQAQWSRQISCQPVSLQDVGLAVSFSRSSEGLYSATLLHEQGASLESGCCSSALEAYWLVLGMVRPECLWIR
ncbi:hypothetical protein SYNGFB01_01275 [Synechococcus sp. GFB01]|nr:hypothetical protein SYNGFB01_01275 [Synechococcus sp. GFB01]